MKLLRSDNMCVQSDGSYFQLLDQHVFILGVTWKKQKLLIEQEQIMQLLQHQLWDDDDLTPEHDLHKHFKQFCKESQFVQTSPHPHHLNSARHTIKLRLKQLFRFKTVFVLNWILSMLHH